jgi:hypothetical protein
MSKTAFAVGMFCVVLCACGSDGSSGGSGVPASTKLEDVSSSELTSLCESHKSQLDGLADPCLGAGLDENSAAECETAQKACEKDNTNPAGSIDCTTADTKDLVDCTATVGEFESCLKSIETFLNDLTCADFGKQLKPPACFDTLSTKCPSLNS